MTQNLALWMLLVVAIAPACTAQDSDEPLQWSLVGGKPFAAEYVRTTDNGVVLRQPSTGRESEIPFSKLDIKSHFQAKKLGNPEAYNKPLVKAEVKPDIPEVEVATITPDDLASPYPTDPTIEQFLSTFKSESDAQNFAAVWHAIPPKMQDDIESLVEKAADKVGPGTIGQVRKMMSSVGTIAQERSEFIFSNPQIQQIPGLDQVKPLWPEISGFVGALTLEQHWQAENFKKGNIVPAIATLQKTISPFAEQLFEKAKPMAPPGFDPSASINYKILSQSKGRAEVEITLPGQPPQKFSFQKVGKIWVVPSLMNQVRKGLDEATKAVDGLQPGQISTATFALTGINAIVGQLASAESQSEFDSSVTQLMQMVQGFMPKPPQQGRPR
ncbi:MAG: hypothetical protein Aurels2KO_10950 [Aureliella sp.]